jgi:hypothetical protein
MQLALFHFVCLLLSAATLFLGRSIIRNPERTIRFFLLGSDPPFARSLLLLWARASGWLFAAGGAFGVVFYLVLIPIDILKR